jgi:hypothetical protein
MAKGAPSYLLSWSWLSVRYEGMLTDSPLPLPPPKASFGGELRAA